MAHAPGQLPHDFHPFSVAHQRFGLARRLFAVLADILADYGEQAPIEARAPAEGMVMPIAVPQAGLDRVCAAGLQ